MRSYLIFILFLQLACASQELQFESYYYKAQTRGFQQELFLKNRQLETQLNGVSTSIELTEKQVVLVNMQIQKIDFKNLKSNLSVEDAAVDRIIPAYCKFVIEKNEFEFDFNHGKLPKKIQALNDLLIELSSLKK